MSDLLQRIEKELRSHSTAEGREADRRFHKYEYKSLGIKTPLFRGVLRSYIKEMQALSCTDAKKLAMQFFETQVEELAQTGTHILFYKLDCLSPKDYNYLDKALDHFTSWSMVDGFAVSILHPLLMKYPKETEVLLRKWNRSKNLWKRRMSVVAFTRRIGASGEFTDLGLELCEAIVEDKEDLVRKGIGWALKDLMKGDRKRVLNYVVDLRKRGISATITLYALRDVKGPERDRILRTS